jgi:hypothetical protein
MFCASVDQFCSDYQGSTVWCSARYTARANRLQSCDAWIDDEVRPPRALQEDGHKSGRDNCDVGERIGSGCRFDSGSRHAEAGMIVDSPSERQDNQHGGRGGLKEIDTFGKRVAKCFFISYEKSNRLDFKFVKIKPRSKANLDGKFRVPGTRFA